MKTLLLSFCSILCSLISFAQTQLPDSIFLIDGRSTNCLIRSVNESKLFFIYNNNQKESIVNNALSKVYVEKFGYIYAPNTGYTLTLDELNDFLEIRFNNYQKEQEVKAELSRVDLTKKTEVKNVSIVKDGIDEIEITNTEFSFSNEMKNKWSFGVLYVPYYSGRTYEMYQNSNYPYQYDLYGFAVNSTSLEAQLAYAIIPELKVTFDGGYSATIVEDNYEYYYRNNDPNYPSITQNGYESTNKMKKLDLNIGAKYYFNNIILEKVSIYASLGIGKQFAFFTDEYKLLFTDPTPGIIDENNRDEFESDINSPFHFHFGFGSEYFFNESLSLNANIRVLYNSASGTFESRYIDEFYNRTSKQEMTVSDFTTKIGIGLNFHF